MNPILQHINNFNNQLRQYSLSIDIRKELIHFFQCWMRMYQDLYYLRALEVYRSGENRHVDMTPFKKDI